MLAVGAGLAVLLPALAVVAMVGGLASLAGGGCPGAATLVASGPVSESDVPSAPPPPYVGAVGNYGLGPDGWSNLATINYVEPDFGQDLSTSQAGAIGVDAVQAVDLGDIPGDPVRRDGPNDPSGGNDPVDAIYTTASYLQGQRRAPATGTARSSPTTTPPGMSARSTATPPTTSPRRAARRPSTSAPSSPAPPAWRTRPAPLSRH